MSTNSGRADEEHVGGVFEEPQCRQFVDHGPIHRGLGVEVEILHPPGCGQAPEAFESGPTTFLGGGHLHLEQSVQEGRVSELVLLGVIKFAR